MLLSDLLITALVSIPEFSGESCTGLCSVVCYDVRNTLVSCNYRSFHILQKENRTYCNSSDLLVCCTAFAVFLYLNFIKASTSAVIDLSNFTWQATLKKIGTSIFNFNYDTTPLWYLYMLIGVYLFIPIIGVWLNTASAKDIRLFWFSGLYRLWYLTLRWQHLCWGIQVIMIMQGFGVYAIGMSLEHFTIFPGF